jgi:hypothetical protein
MYYTFLHGVKVYTRTKSRTYHIFHFYTLHMPFFTNRNIYVFMSFLKISSVRSMSHVTCHMSHVTCHMSHATCHMPHATCHMPHVTCHMSHATCHMPHATCQCIHLIMQACVPVCYFQFLSFRNFHVVAA